MTLFAGLTDNLRLMVVHVVGQLEATRAILARPESAPLEAVLQADDYIDIQKSLIENQFIEFLTQTRSPDSAEVDAARAANIIASNLERIADCAVNVVRQLRFLDDRHTLADFDTDRYMKSLIAALEELPDALSERDSSKAMRMCRVEDELDRYYQADLTRIHEALAPSRKPAALVTVLFILHYLERMGDAVQNIGEAVILACTGERLKIHEYRVLEEATSTALSSRRDLSHVELASIWGTRSGARIGTLQAPPDGGGQPIKVLFKKGQPHKLRAEQAALAKWREIDPGLVPEVVDFQQRGEDAALLVQYLRGTTLQQLVIDGASQELEHAHTLLWETLDRIWVRTRRDGPIVGSAMDQLQKRMPEVLRAHEESQNSGARIAGRSFPSLAELIKAAREAEVAHPAPFTVFIHGDFNLDNVLYNIAENRIHFVDVHRSEHSDYVQDVSVFLVSCFRMPVFIPHVRERLEGLAVAFLRQARAYASRARDDHFELRLALGLARSLITSTRFEFHDRFVRSMMERASYLLNRIAGWKPDKAEFQVPDDVLRL